MEEYIQRDLEAIKEMIVQELHTGYSETVGTADVILLLPDLIGLRLRHGLDPYEEVVRGDRARVLIDTILYEYPSAYRCLVELSRR